MPPRLEDDWTPEIEPGTEQYYEGHPDFFIQVAREMVDEWEYEGDEHRYCHERSVLVGLLAEIERLRDVAAGTWTAEEIADIDRRAEARARSLEGLID
jgi:hypothetical protein